MKHLYVGVVPRHLESGRPVYFGDELDSLSAQDCERLSDYLVEQSTDKPKTATTEDK